MAEPGDVKPWFREDITKVLMGVNTASRVSRSLDPGADAFHDGFVVALASIGLVFGVKLENFLLPDDLETVQHLIKHNSHFQP